MEKETLLKLSDEFKALQTMLEDETDKDLVADTLEALQGNFEYKLEG
jgi:hypothetical protein